MWIGLKTVLSMNFFVSSTHFIVILMHAARETVRALIDIVKIPAAATESYQALDFAKVFMLVARLYLVNTTLL